MRLAPEPSWAARPKEGHTNRPPSDRRCQSADPTLKSQSQIVASWKAEAGPPASLSPTRISAGPKHKLKIKRWVRSKSERPRLARAPNWLPKTLPVSSPLLLSTEPSENAPPPAFEALKRGCSLRSDGLPRDKLDEVIRLYCPNSTASTSTRLFSTQD